MPFGLDMLVLFHILNPFDFFSSTSFLYSCFSSGNYIMSLGLLGYISLPGLLSFYLMNLLNILSLEYFLKTLTRISFISLILYMQYSSSLHFILCINSLSLTALDILVYVLYFVMPNIII